jgi:hypothetical protein
LQAVTVTWTWSVLVERFTRGAAAARVICSRDGGATWVTCIAPLPPGQPLGGTTAVGAEFADVDPAELLAVTVETRVWPTSLLLTLCDFPVAPAILVHVPAVSHRLHA